MKKKKDLPLDFKKIKLLVEQGEQETLDKYNKLKEADDVVHCDGE